MIRVRQVKVNIDDNSLENIKKCTSKKLKTTDDEENYIDYIESDNKK